MRAVAKFSLSPLLRRDLCSSRSPHKRWNPNLAPNGVATLPPPATKCYCRVKKRLFSSGANALASQRFTDPDMKGRTTHQAGAQTVIGNIPQVFMSCRKVPARSSKRSSCCASFKLISEFRRGEKNCLA